MTDAEETAYTLGHRMALTQILSVVVQQLGYAATEANAARWILEREAVVNQLRGACADYGDNDWPNDLHLGDVIEKHLVRHLESARLEEFGQDE